MPLTYPTPKDSGGIPVSCVLIPGVGLIALGGANVLTDGSGNQYAAASLVAADVTQAGTITADQGAVTATFGAGVASWAADISGTFNSGTTLNFEFLLNSAWYQAFGVPIGSTADIAVSSVVGGAAVTYQGNAAGFQAFRVRAHPFNTGDNITVKIVGSVATDGGFVSKSLPPGANNIGIVNVQHGNVIDSANSSTTLLTANSVFTGTGQSSLFYSAISVEVFADQASAAGGLSIQQSQDNVNWDIKDTFTITASTPFATIINLVGQYYHVVYTNGGTNQGTFRLQVVKQAAESVVPRTLSALGNLKIAIQEPALGQAAMASSLPVTMANNQSTIPIQIAAIAAALSNANPVPILNAAQQGFVAAYGSNPANTGTANTDAVFKWGAGGTTQINHLMIQNNSTADVLWDLDTATTSGSPHLISTAPGNTLFLDIQTSALHVQTSVATVAFNAASGIIVRGWL